MRTATAVTAVGKGPGGLTVRGRATGDGARPFAATVDLVLVVVGVRPDTALAETAGVRLGVRGAVAVDRHMRTGVAGVLAAGDCVHTYHRLLDTAQVVKVFDLVVARTGLREHEARAHGLDPVSHRTGATTTSATTRARGRSPSRSRPTRGPGDLHGIPRTAPA